MKHFKLFRTHLKNFLNLVRSESVENQFETSIRMDPNQFFNPNLIEQIRARVDLNRISNPNQSELIQGRNDLNEKFSSNQPELGFIQFDSD